MMMMIFYASFWGCAWRGGVHHVVIYVKSRPPLLETLFTYIHRYIYTKKTKKKRFDTIYKDSVWKDRYLAQPFPLERVGWGEKVVENRNGVEVFGWVWSLEHWNRGDFNHFSRFMSTPSLACAYIYVYVKFKFSPPEGWLIRPVCITFKLSWSKLIMYY